MNPYWIEADSIRLAILPRPRGNDWLADDIAAARRAGVDVIVSTLTNEETEELGLSDEAECCRRSNVQFLSFPIADRSLPRSINDLSRFLDEVDKEIRKKRAWRSIAEAASGGHLCYARVYEFAASSRLILHSRGYETPAGALCQTPKNSEGGLSPLH